MEKGSKELELAMEESGRVFRDLGSFLEMASHEDTRALAKRMAQHLTAYTLAVELRGVKGEPINQATLPKYSRPKWHQEVKKAIALLNENVKPEIGPARKILAQLLQ